MEFIIGHSILKSKVASVSTQRYMSAIEVNDIPTIIKLLSSWFCSIQNRLVREDKFIQDLSDCVILNDMLSQMPESTLKPKHVVKAVKSDNEVNENYSIFKTICIERLDIDENKFFDQSLLKMDSMRNIKSNPNFLLFIEVLLTILVTASKTPRLRSKIKPKLMAYIAKYNKKIRTKKNKYTARACFTFLFKGGLFILLLNIYAHVLESLIPPIHFEPILDCVLEVSFVFDTRRYHESSGYYYCETEGIITNSHTDPDPESDEILISVKQDVNILSYLYWPIFVTLASSTFQMIFWFF